MLCSVIKTEDLLMKKTVLITGCSSGIGKTTAYFYAEQGWNVVATMRDVSMGADLAQAGITVLQLDVQDKHSIAQALDQAISRFGRIDVLVNNAGFGLFGVFESIPDEKIRQQFDVNLFGVMDVTRSLLPHFRQNKAGVIVNVSSGAGVFTLPMLSLYCASKFALEGFSEALSYELLPLGIQVKLVEPGGVVSTNFGQRSAAEAGYVNAVADYTDFTAATAQVFAGLRQTRLGTELDVAEVIYQASVDDSEQLRYVATEDIKPLLQARRETCESDYIQLMRSTFGYQPAS
jgi:NAD(P)-dependent dehydrogenase (short-subunit alcohol dehydrogenase family)